MVEREERAEEIERNKKCPINPQMKKKLFHNSKLGTILPLAMLSDTGFDTTKTQMYSPRSKDVVDSQITGSQTFRNISYRRKYKKKMPNSQKSLDDIQRDRIMAASKKLLLSEKPRLFPDFEKQPLFPKLPKSKQNKKPLIKPYLHNMSYEDLMKWKKKNYCKQYNNLTIKITKETLNNDIKRRHQRMLRKCRRINNHHSRRSKSSHQDPKAVQAQINRNKLIDLKDQLDQILSRKVDIVNRRIK